MLSFISIGLFVTMGTIILVLIAKGYDFDFKKKEIVQNGLVLIGSEPVSAQVIIDEVDTNDTTPHRAALHDGGHSVKLLRDGFREWSRQFDLAPSEVLWLNYPLLLPNSLATSEVSKFAGAVTTYPSPDNARMATVSAQKMIIFLANQSDREAQTIDLALSLPGLPGTITDLVWADDNSSVLATVTDGNTTNQILVTLTREPTFANLSTILSGYANIEFNPNENNIFYGLKVGGLWRIELDPAKSPEKIVESADRFSAFDRSVLTWSATSQRLVLLDPSKSTVIDSPPITDLTDLSLSSHDGKMVAAMTTPSLGTHLFVAPGKADQTHAVHMRAGDELLFSPGAGYLASHSGQAFQVYDLERQRFYTFDLPIENLKNLRWATGAHLLAIADGSYSALFDFDGQNFQHIAAAIPGAIQMSPDRQHILHLATSAVDGLPIVADTLIAP